MYKRQLLVFCVQLKLIPVWDANHQNYVLPVIALAADVYKRQNYDRVKLAYDALTKGEGLTAQSGPEGIQASYDLSLIHI